MSNDKKEKALSEFKEKYKDIIKPTHNDHFLLRWLKARNYDVEKAAKMYQTSMAYREKMAVETLLEKYDQPEVVKKYFAGGFCGYDLEGAPIRVELYGRLDIKGLMYSARKVDLEKAKLREGEWIEREGRRQSAKLGKHVEGLTVIVDMEGMSSRLLWRPGIQMYLHLVKTLEDNYPDIVKRLLLINAPKIFPLLWRISRGLLSDDMKRKIHILGKNYRSTLLKYVDVNELPAYLGGNKTDPDGNPRCPAQICQGGLVPDEYYISELSVTDHLKTETISKGDKLCLEFRMDKPGSLLRWEFKTEEHDLAFGVIYVTENGKETVVVHMERVNCHMVPESGAYLCEEPGTCRVCFDNSFSLVRSKYIKYVIDIMESDEQTITEMSKAVENGVWNGLSESLANMEI